VPISLLVTLEMVKFLQAQFITWDYMIYDVDKDIPTKVQTSNLNEELGCVKYVFSDKTGTLTQNVMQFKKFTAGSHQYGVSNPSEDAMTEHCPEGVTNVFFEDQNVWNHIKSEDHSNRTYLKRFMTHLAVCHTIIIEPSTTG